MFPLLGARSRDRLLGSQRGRLRPGNQHPRLITLLVALVLLGGVAITVVIASGGGTLDGTTTVETALDGAAVFSSLTLTGTPGPRTLRFTGPGLTPGTSSRIDLEAGPATRFLGMTQPSAVTTR